MLIASRSLLVVLALLNSSIVNAVFEFGFTKVIQLVETNGIDITESADACCTDIARTTKIPTAIAICAFTHNTLLTLINN